MMRRFADRFLGFATLLDDHCLICLICRQHYAMSFADVADFNGFFHVSVLCEHFSGRIEKYEVESSKRLAAADGDVKKSPCKVGIWRSRRAHDVLLGAGSLGLMNGSGVCSLQR